jgi:hypothetical protein
MADSANILSILAALSAPQAPDPGITPTTFTPPPADNSVPPNVLQALAPPQGQAAPPPQPAAPSSSEDIYHAATADAPPTPTAPARARSSLLDKIGRVADVLATVGGATPLYQPTLDSRQDRVLALGDHDRKASADDVALATSKFDLGDKQNTRVGQAARGLKAIMAANPNIPVDQAWPVLAQRMQLDPATAASFGKVFAEHPEEIDGVIAAMTDPKFDQSKYGGSIVYGTDASGKLVAYQPGLGNNEGRNVLPEGITPIDPLKFVDTGNAQVGVGTRSGRPTRILPKGVSPDQANRSSTAITIAGMPARAQAGKNAGPNAAFIETAQGNIDELKNIYTNLKKMGAMVSPAQAADRNVVARIRASGIGQVLEGAVGTQAQTQRDRVASIRPQLMQSLAKATGMTGKQLDSNADVKLFMQTVTDPTKSYEANMEAINGLERFLKANAKTATAATPAAPAAARPKPKSGWTIVKVQ